MHELSRSDTHRSTGNSQSVCECREEKERESKDERKTESMWVRRRNKVRKEGRTDLISKVCPFRISFQTKEKGNANSETCYMDINLSRALVKVNAFLCFFQQLLKQVTYILFKTLIHKTQIQMSKLIKKNSTTIEKKCVNVKTTWSII